MSEGSNLAEKLSREIERVTELRAIYEGLPNMAGAFGAAFMKQSLEAAHRANATGDVVAMIRACKDLEGYKS